MDGTPALSQAVCFTPRANERVYLHILMLEMPSHCACVSAV